MILISAIYNWLILHSLLINTSFQPFLFSWSIRLLTLNLTYHKYLLQTAIAKIINIILLVNLNVHNNCTYVCVRLNTTPHRKWCLSIKFSFINVAVTLLLDMITEDEHINNLHERWTCRILVQLTIELKNSWFLVLIFFQSKLDNVLIF